MASNGILLEAIRKLEINNMELRNKLSDPNADKDTILKEIARNDSMILDFKFRLKYE